MMVNGKETAIGEGMTRAGLIDSLGYSKSRIAVELNGSIVPRSEYDNTILGDDDRIEIVGMVGRG
ncbi:MAG: sulfur carrier protein ThiS [Candidatus Methanomethylophilaceae archaeon]|jgi:sulfur carrier protein